MDEARDFLPNSPRLFTFFQADDTTACDFHDFSSSTPACALASLSSSSSTVSSSIMLALAPPPQQHPPIAYPTPSTSSTAVRPSRTPSRRPSSYSGSAPSSSSNSSTVTTPAHPSSSHQEETSHSQRSGTSHPQQPQPSSSRHSGDDIPGGHASHSHLTPSQDSISLPRADVHIPEIDIHSYDSQDLLRLLASLLTQIATTNDNITGRDLHATPSIQHHPSNMPGSPTTEANRPPIWRTLTTASKHALSHNMSLIFHARNIPTITLEAYLLRILRYCPASNEVFLSLLVYFDRMSRLAKEACGRPFIIDSFNIHRLVIAGVTVASKFFSDVFYTNSRYAKVRVHYVWGVPKINSSHIGRRFAAG